MNIAELSLNSLELGEHVSIIFEGKEFTNLQMDSAAQRLGNALKELGVKRGDRVILQMPNCPEILQSFQAIWKIGAIVVPINYLAGEEDIAHIYKDSGVSTIISSPEYLDKIKAALIDIPNKINIIMVPPEQPEGTISFQKLVDDYDDKLEIEKTDDEEVAAIVYTSGTTGRPKGVMLTHYGLCNTAKMQQDTTNLPQDLVSLAVLPLCHSYGIATMNGSFLRLKGKVIILRSLNLEQMFSAIDKYKVQSLAAVPTIYVYMLLFPDTDKYDLSSMKYYFCGSAPLSLDTWKKFKEKFGGEIAEGWGLTEAGATCTLNPLDGLKKVSSIGIPLNGIEMKIFDNDDKEVIQGKKGEIVLRGPMVMKGYWNLPRETEEAIKNGWLHTGDIGYVDEAGYFFITDRKKDIIIKGGENISPRTIEEVLMDFSKIAEASVIGIRDDVLGEDIKGFVKLKPNQKATPEEIIDFCRTKLTKFLVPKELAIMDELPKTIVGKILKKELRKLQ